jgi:hypothetical protein
MNERIKELMDQAGIDVEAVENLGAMPAALKFALLIARECRDIVGKTRDQAIEDGWNIEEAMSTAMYDIDEHFGVEK